MADLPITRVVLFKHGVGYFEREGHVEGDANLTLTFKQREVSDVLKSLTVLDLDDGHVAAVSYDSTKPLEQLLAEVALSIPDSGSLVGLVPQLKGARVALRPDPKGPELQGVLLGVDEAEMVGEGGIAREALVSVLTDAGEMLSFDLYQGGLQLLDAGLRRDLEFYLRTQLSAKKKDARAFTLFAQGEGRRRVRMSYVLEAPVWKATYRILLEEPDNKGEPLIQGWAVVDNTQDEDWSEVRLSLVAGLPVSFTHDLYTPRYIRRPEVAVKETTGVLPPELEGGIETVDETITDFDPGALRAAAAMPARPPAAGAAMYRKKVTGAAMLGEPARVSAVSSVQTQTRERQVGDLFEYEIERPVTIRRNQSALVPIVLKPFRGRSVLLYQKAARAENPMRCVAFENTTGLTLEGGPVTVLEGGSYVGEAMLDTLKPTEQRLIGYAVELGVRVLDNIDSHNEDVHRVVVRKGLLKAFYAQVQVTTYTFASKSDRAEVVYLDHPRGSADWKLADTPKPRETTENYWRFQFDLPARATTTFVVRQQRPLYQSQTLLEAGDPQLQAWLSQKYLDARTGQALRQAFELRAQAAEREARHARLQAERDQIHAEQKRIRENLNALGDRPSEKELRERFVRTLNTQEDRLEAIERESKQLLAERDALRSRVAEELAKLDYEGSVA